MGQAARRSGVSAKAVRLYELRGLLPAAERTEAGYRLYAERDVAVLRFIRQARSLGLRLDEIKEIIDLERGGIQPCETVLRVLDTHLREIDRTLADLRALKKLLVRVRDAAEESQRSGETAVVCRIIEAAQNAG